MHVIYQSPGARYILGLTMALALLLALRLPLIRCGTFGADVTNFNDEINYLSLAHSLAAGDSRADTELGYTRAPGASLLLLGLSWLRGLPLEQVVCDFQLVQVAIWAGLLLLLATLAAVLWGRRVALITALLVAILPEVALLSLLIYSETLFCAGLVVTVGALLAHSRRPHPAWLALAGVAAGLGALARPTLLPLLPVLALWAGGGTSRNEYKELTTQQHSATKLCSLFSVLRSLFSILRSSFSVRTALLFLVCCVLTIAPWTWRNYRMYGGLIVVDTTGPLNLWFSNVDAERGAVLSAAWASSPNPVERQRFTSGQAWAAITGDPGRFGRKLLREGVGAWAPRSFLVRRDFWADFLQQPRTGALLAQLDGLLAATLPLALLGLLFAPHTAPGAQGYRVAVVGLAACYTLMMAATHFEGRYRTPFLLLLLPYTAWCLAHPRQLLASLRSPLGYGALGLTCALAIFYGSALWPAQWHNARALVLHGRGLLRASAGDIPGALADQRAAAALQPSLREASIAAAQLASRSGDLAGAELTLRAVLAEARENYDDAPEALVVLQQLLLSQGRTNEAAELGSWLSIPGRRQAEALAWGRGVAPLPAVRLGEDDLGRAEGFYNREQGDLGTFRWSRPEARLLMSGRDDYLCLYLSGGRPLDTPAPQVSLSLGGKGAVVPLGRVLVPRQGWAWACVPAGDTLDGGTFELQLAATSYSPGLEGHGTDPRSLGVALAEVALRSGPLTLEPASGLLLDRIAPDSGVSPRPLHVVGLSGELRGRPGATLPVTLWWRGTESPPPGTFSFLHLLSPAGATVASYNAPLAAGALPVPWVANELLADATALLLPADLPPGNYRLEAGAFDPSSGAVLAQADLGALLVQE